MERADPQNRLKIQDAAIEHQTIIPGLPSEIALRCLARIPYYMRGAPRAVSKKWLEAFSSSEMYNFRKDNGILEELVCVECTSDPFSCSPSQARRSTAIFRALDPVHRRWVKLPPLSRHEFVQHTQGNGEDEDEEILCHGFACAGVEGKLFVMGGSIWEDGAFRGSSRKVWCLDVPRGKWEQVESMSSNRDRGFAAGRVNGAVMAAGGKWNASAEVLNPATGKWKSLPSIPCSFANHAGPGHWGVVMKGVFHMVQLNGPCNDATIPTVWYDADRNLWSAANSFWHTWPWAFGDFSWLRSEYFCELGGHLYYVRHKERGYFVDIPEVVRCNLDTGVWEVVAKVPAQHPGWQHVVTLNKHGERMTKQRRRPEGGSHWVEASVYTIAVVNGKLCILEQGLEYNEKGHKLGGACFWYLLNVGQSGAMKEQPVTEDSGLTSIGEDPALEDQRSSQTAATSLPVAVWEVKHERMPDSHIQRGLGVVSV